MPRKPMRSRNAGPLLQDLSLGVIMRYLPRQEVKRALADTKTDSIRERLLPAVAVAYLVVMLALYSEVSVRENLRILLEPLRRMFGADSGGNEYEPGLFDTLQPKLVKDMLLLADRFYYDFSRWKACAKQAGALLWRVKNNLNLPPVLVLEDGARRAMSATGLVVRACGSSDPATDFFPPRRRSQPTRRRSWKCCAKSQRSAFRSARGVGMCVAVKEREARILRSRSQGIDGCRSASGLSCYHLKLMVLGSSQFASPTTS